ncbi:MAG: VWA domain-containing protein [Thermoanaerobaculia bacterium]
MNTIRASLLAALAGLGLAQPAPGQPAPAPQRERVRVSLVQVPVTVVDGEGRPVPGLTASDFDVRDDGEPVRLGAVDPIEYAGRRSGEALTAAETSATRVTSAAGLRKFLLLFDLTFASQTELRRTLEAATRFVREQMGDWDIAAVATVSAGGGVKLLQQFTPDRARLSEVLDAEKNTDAWERVQPAYDGARIASTRNDGGIDSDVFTSVVQDHDRYRRQLASRLLGRLEDLAARLETIPGRKHVLLFSHGFDPQLLTGVVAMPSGPRDLRESPFGDTEAHGDAGLRAELDRMAAGFRRHDAVVWAVDLGGVAAAVAETPEQRAGTFARGRESLAAIAHGTGGELLTGSNDFGPLLDRILEATRAVYLLNFTPARTRGAGSFHPLKVKVLRRGARVSVRAGYYERAG